MNKKTVVTLLLSTLMILVGASQSVARPQYLTSLNEVYSSGSCNTCHIIAPGSGMRDFNGTGNPNGTYEPRNNRTSGQHSPNRTNGTRNFNRTLGMDNSNRTMPRNSYGTLFESQPDHATDPNAALITIGAPSSAIQADTVPAGTQAAPGFEIVSAFVGLVACALVAKRHNK